MTTPQQARQQLAQAEKLRSTAAGFSPTWIIYLALCGAGPMYLLGNLNSGGGFTPATIMSLTWIFVFITLIPVFNRTHPTAKRGFGRRWGIMMALWAVTWGLSVAVPSNTNTAMMLSVVFLCLAVAGPVWEAFAQQKSSEA